MKKSKINCNNMILKAMKIALISTLVAALLIVVGGTISSGEYGLFFLYLVMSMQAFIPLFLFSLMYLYVKDRIFSSVINLTLRVVFSSASSILLSIIIYVIIENSRIKSSDLIGFLMVCIIVGIGVPIIDRHSDNLFHARKK
jgi:hypothetical protein